MDYEVHHQGLVAEADSFELADHLARELADRSPRIYRVTRDEVPSSLMPVGDLPGWRQVLAEDFTRPVPVGGFVANQQGILTPAGAQGYAAYGPGAPSELRLYPDGWDDTWKGGYYAPSRTVSVRDDIDGATGVFDVWCHHGVPLGKSAARGMGAAVWFPGRDGRWNKGPFMRAEYRMRAVGFNTAPSRYGAVPLFIGSPWPANGELDWPEGELTGDIHGFYHHANPGNTQEPFSASGFRWEDWHVYAIEWLPDRVRFLADGQVVKESTRMVPQQAMPFVIQSATYAPGPDPATEGHLQIDWVTLYAYAPSA